MSNLKRTFIDTLLFLLKNKNIIEKQIRYLISMGENIHTEFKRCKNGFGSDIYETVCAFENRFCGDILYGGFDNGKIEGVLEKSVTVMIKNFTTIISNP